MRKLVENAVAELFEEGLCEISEGIEDSLLEIYLRPLKNFNFGGRNKWLTASRLNKIKRLILLLSDEQLLTALTDQHCDKFR